MRVADDTFQGISECEWVDYKVILMSIIVPDDNFLTSKDCESA